MNLQQMENNVSELYLAYQNAENVNSKLNIINAIIQIKVASDKNANNVGLYVDVKNFIRLSVLAIEDNKSLYYEISPEIIISIISHLMINERISILKFLLRELKRNGHENNFNWINREIKKNKIKRDFGNLFNRTFYKKPTYLVQLILNLSTYNLLSIIGVVFLFFIGYSIILLPAKSSTSILFNSVFVNYSDEYFYNHLLNAVISFFGIESDFKLNPINGKGVLVAIFLKLIIVVFVINYLIEEIKSKLKS